MENIYIYIVLEYIRLQTITEYSATTETQHVTRVTLQLKKIYIYIYLYILNVVLRVVPVTIHLKTLQTECYAWCYVLCYTCYALK